MAQVSDLQAKLPSYLKTVKTIKGVFSPHLALLPLLLLPLILHSHPLSPLSLSSPLLSSPLLSSPLLSSLFSLASPLSLSLSLSPPHLSLLFFSLHFFNKALKLYRESLLHQDPLHTLTSVGNLITYTSLL